MTSVPTYNIIIAFNEEIFYKLKETTPDSLSAFLRENDDAVLFTNIADSFLSLTHNVRTLTQTDTLDNFSITLEVLDPQKLFDGRFLVNSIKALSTGNHKITEDARKEVDKLSSILERQEQFKKGGLASLASDFESGPNSDLRELVRIKNSIDLEKASIEKDEIMGDKTSSKFWWSVLGSFGSLDNSKSDLGDDGELFGLDIGDSQESLDKRKDALAEKIVDYEKKYTTFIQKVRNRLDKILQSQQESGSKVYISYGCGNNFNSWAGPFCCFFKAASYKFVGDAGFRSVSLIFGVKSGPGFGTPTVDKAVLGFGINVDANVKVFSKSVNKNEELLKAKQNLDVSDLRAASRSKSDFRINKALKNLEYKEISSDVDINYHYYITTCIRNYISSVTGGDNNIAVLFPDLNKILKKRIDSFKKQFQNQERFKNAKFDLGNDLKINAQDLYVAGELFRELGFTVSVTIYQDGKPVQYDFDKLFSTNVTPGNEAVDEECTTGNFAFDMTIHIYKSKEDDFYAPLERLISGFRKTTQIIDPVLISENKQPFLDDLKIYLDKMDFEESTRRSNQSDNERYILAKIKPIYAINKSQPLVLFGDSTFIERLFYGKRYLEKTGIFKFGYGDNRNDLNSTNTNKNDVETTQVSYEADINQSDSAFLSDEYLDIAVKHFQTPKPSGCFDFSNLPTSMFYFTDEDVTGLKKANIPIFNYGTVNSNVLDFDVNVDQLYFASLNNIIHVASNNFKYNNGSTSIDPSAIVNPYIDKKDDSGAFKRTLIPLPRDAEGNRPQADDVINVAVELATNNVRNRGYIKEVPWWGEANPHVFQLALMAEMSKLAWNATIRTLPMFGFSDTPKAINPALLFVQENSYLGARKVDTTQNIFNGWWAIWGFEHTISKNDAYSVFHIMKDTRLQPPPTLVPQVEESSIVPASETTVN